MSTVTPPSTSPLPPPVALPRAIVLNASPQLINLGVGAKIEAVVSQLIDTSQIRLTTNFGDVTIKLPTRIPVTIGQPLLLQLQTTDEQPRVQISTLNGLPLGTKGTASPATGNAASLSAPSTPTSATGQPFVLGGQITATLLRAVTVTPTLTVVTTAQPGSTTNPSTTSAIPAGGATPQGSQTIASLASPGQPGTGQTTSSANTTQQGQQTMAIPAGSSLNLKVVSFTVPQTPNPSLSIPKFAGPVSLQTGATLTGVVTGTQGVSQTVVQTQAGPVSLPTANALPRGTLISFEIFQLDVSKTQGNHELSILRPLSGPGGTSWPALNDTLDVLGNISPAAQTQILQAALPRADAQLSTNILFFLSALRGGDLKGWLGDGPLRILERQRPDLAGRLRDDLGQLSRQITDPDTGDWRMHAVPYLNNDEIDRIRMLVRDQDDEDDDTPADSTRFVIDLNLSQMGHLQIDGLVGNGGKRVDVVLRSDAVLSVQMRDDIRALYANAIEITGIDGSVGFQAAPAKFINIPEPQSNAVDGMVV